MRWTTALAGLLVLAVVAGVVIASLPTVLFAFVGLAGVGLIRWSDRIGTPRPAADPAARATTSARRTAGPMRRLVERSGEPPPFVTDGGRWFDPPDELVAVTVGDVTLDGTITGAYPRDVPDWSTGIRLEAADGDPIDLTTLPAGLVAAGAAVLTCTSFDGDDGQDPEFGVGEIVRLAEVPLMLAAASDVASEDPGIAVLSLDGERLAGYLHAPEELDPLRGTAPTLGLVVWENVGRRPRRRKAIRILIGPSVGIVHIPASERPAEAARREAVHAAARLERERVARAARETVAHDAEAVAHDAEPGLDRRELERLRRAAGVCLSCGDEIVPQRSGDRPWVRCRACRRAVA